MQQSFNTTPWWGAVILFALIASKPGIAPVLNAQPHLKSPATTALPNPIPSASQALIRLQAQIDSDPLVRGQPDGLEVWRKDRSIWIRFFSEELFSPGEVVIHEFGLNLIDRMVTYLDLDVRSQFGIRIHGFSDQDVALEKVDQGLGANGFALAMQRAEWLALYLKRQHRWNLDSGVELVAHAPVTRGRKIEIEVFENVD